MEKLHHTLIQVTFFILYQVVCEWCLFNEHSLEIVHCCSGT